MLLYGNLGWGGTHKTTLDSLDKAQKLILKIIYHRHRLYPSSQLYSESGVLTVRQLYVKTTLIHFRQHFRQSNQRAHTYETRMRSAPLPPRMRKRFGQRHFIFLAPKFYNTLPLDIQNQIQASKFKKAIHRWILEIGIEGTELLLLPLQ